MSTGKVVGRIVALLLVTSFAIAVMFASSGAKIFQTEDGGDETEALVDPDPASPVKAQSFELEWVELKQEYAGKIRPFERFTLGFEMPGRIARLGVGASGSEFDTGVPVSAGDVVAYLDDEALRAQWEEADARLERAQLELNRVLDLKQRNPKAVTGTRVVEAEADKKIAEAQAKLAAKRLADAELKAEFDGVTAKRFFSAGESVAAQQPVFEIVQVDRVLLVVGVPESQIRPVLDRQKTVSQWQQTSGADVPRSFKVDVELMGVDVFGRPWPAVTGSVYSIGETSDDTSGLFEVEVLIENPNGVERTFELGNDESKELWAIQLGAASHTTTYGREDATRQSTTTTFSTREEAKTSYEKLITQRANEGYKETRPAPARLRPGQIALGSLVVDEIEALRIPTTAAIFEENRAFIYCVRPDPDEPSVFRAHRVELPAGEYVEQNDHLILRQLPADSRRVVIDGQHRLAPGRRVTLLSEESRTTEEKKRGGGRQENRTAPPETKVEPRQAGGDQADELSRAAAEQASNAAANGESERVEAPR
ncbi:MAG: efflux RND transporter periplasmic adaptor subunit [Pirellulaceae bacterium]|jgi:RND family efflux transporter MFP subunit|nr:efflux RND transporter periplasmic adaptor subunit [Pirellulaceae bacterium]